MNARNANWDAIKDKIAGDEIQLAVCRSVYDREAERLVTGTVGKCTSATRHFTMPGALRDGEIRFGLNMLSPNETHGLVANDGERYWFRIATESDVARITDPNRALREAAEDAMRDVLRFRLRVESMDKAAAAGLLADLAAATRAVQALHDAL